MRAAILLAWVMAAGLLSACGSLKNKPGPNPNTSFEPPAATNPPGATEDKTETAPATTPPPVDAQPAPATAASTDCVPPPKKPQPQPPSKPRPVRKEPPPPPTAPVVVDTPRGGVVGSEIKATPEAVMSVLGVKVQGPKGEDLGRIVDVLADASGRTRIAIIDFGGFLGVGDRKLAVEWPLLRFNPSAPSSVVLSVEREKLKSLPEYKGAERPKVLMALPAPTTTPASGDGKQ